MSQFITREDYGASIHAEILDAVTRSDETIVELCQERAISEMKMVLMMAVDIAIYHIFSVHNPRTISEVRVERYKRALEWLRRVRRGDEDIDGLPELEAVDREKASQYLLRSNPKRTNNI